ncbi:protein MIS12 homolog isoform X2 [Antedon mediterranea]|uniref:protein MIS12 homolog isoform X2 n=1 Tax=Antedon mediterranea TaxID=105859 RepID=UPI003AF54B9F
MSVDQSSTSGSRMSMRQESGVLQVDDKNEYETQFFGFTPKSFVDGVYNAIFEYLRDGIELLEKYLVSEFEKDGVSKEIVREGSQKLLSHFRVRFDRACDKLERYLMKNIFHIPSKMIQTCDVVNQENNYTESEEQLLDDEIQQLQIKIQNVKYTNAYLKQYIMDMEKVQNQLDNVLSKVESMEKICNQAGDL